MSIIKKEKNMRLTKEVEYKFAKKYRFGFLFLSCFPLRRGGMG